MTSLSRQWGRPAVARLAVARLAVVRLAVAWLAALATEAAWPPAADIWLKETIE